MPKRPFFIIFLSSLYIIVPPLLLFSRDLFHWNIFPAALWNSKAVLWVILGLYIVNGLAIISFRKKGWWLFVIGSLLLMSFNILGYLRSPDRSLMVLIVINGLIFLGTALVFRKEIIAPYFNPRLRWWESDPRFKVDFSCTVHQNPSVTGKVIDISSGGCYISTTEVMTPHEEVPIELHLQDIQLRLQGRVMRHGDFPCKGWGIRFNPIDHIEENGLNALMQRLAHLSGHTPHDSEKREHSRLRIPQWIYWEDKGIQEIGMLMNLSKSGCCIKSDKVHFDDNLDYILDFRSFEEGLVFNLRKIWQQNKGEIYLTGLQFVIEGKDERVKLHQLLDIYRKMGAKNRTYESEMDKALLRTSLEMTPVAALYKD